METFDLVTFENIYTAVLRQVKGDVEDEESLNKVKESIVTRYRTLCSRKKWKFLRETNRSLKLPKKHTDGTISTTNDSRVITGSGTNWTSSMEGWWISPNGSDKTYRVILVESSTRLLVNTPFLETDLSNAGYKLWQSELALFPDLDDIDDIRIDGERWKVYPKGPAFINMMRQRYPKMEGRPRYYSIEGQALFEPPILSEWVLSYDFLGSVKTKAVHFFPSIPDKDYTAHIPYKKIVKALANPSDEPLIPINHRIILRHAAMADWYSSNGQDPKAAYYEKLYMKEEEELMSKYLDTDDIVQFRPKATGHYSHSYLLRHSSRYFDTEG